MQRQAAAAEPMMVAGGVLDPSVEAVDAYVGTPVSGAVPEGRACGAASRYIALINAGDFAKVADLFEDDAIVLDPQGARMSGRAEIDAFYRGKIGAMRPALVAVAYVGGDVDCMVEIAFEQPVAGVLRYVLVSVDHFTIGRTGKIQRMVAFGRSPRGVR